MPWLVVSVTVPAAHVERLCDTLLAAGASSASAGDANADTAGECALFDRAALEDGDIWPHARVSAIFAEKAQLLTIVPQALAAAGLDPELKFEVETLAERDWVRASQDQFHPLQISPRLWVVPTWHTPPVPSALNLIIDPGLAFGTGTHPTTRLCLQWLDANLKNGQRVLDYGCGSGILAIAALKLGAAAAVGVDIDEPSLLTAAQNGLQNRVPVQFDRPDRVASAEYDVVIANILANPLRLLAPLLARATAPGGYLVLAGILVDQAAEVVENYLPWLPLAVSARVDDWVLLSGVKPVASTAAALQRQ